MKIKKSIYNIVLGMLLFNFCAGFLKGIKLPAEVFYFLTSLVFGGIAIILYRPVLKFLTLPDNFWTCTVATAILVFLALYALDLSMPLFYVKSMKLNSQHYDFITIKEIVLNETMVMLLMGVLSGLLNSLINFLKKSE